MLKVDRELSGFADHECNTMYGSVLVCLMYYVHTYICMYVDLIYALCLICATSRLQLYISRSTAFMDKRANEW
jgi:hypothetical protein